MLWQFLIGKTVQKLSLQTNASHCLRERFKDHTCKDCVDICPTQAITLKQNRVVVNEDKCNGCGLCTLACPTEVFHLESSNLRKYELMFHNQETACISCKKQSEDENMAILPCLRSLSPEILMVAALKQTTLQILLDPTECEKCDYHWDQAELLRWIEAWNSSWNGRYPIEIVDHKKNVKSRSKKISRRDLLSFTKEKVTYEVGSFVFNSFETHAVKDKIPMTLRRKYLQLFINKEREIGESLIHKNVISKLSVCDIRVKDECTVCDKCSKLCPTGALTVRDVEHVKSLGFERIKCIDCGICNEICVHITRNEIDPESNQCWNQSVSLKEHRIDSCPCCGNEKSEYEHLCEECKLKKHRQDELMRQWLGKDDAQRMNRR
ncbi:4Fe-4S binding protein [Brevibacillus sp. SYSU BS000544]|uniref:4Fe-4S binding protein n=1 Tax=Brevibacillus sp. SYSU BS000544 TaxID=3416443 RepID=UPI003CE5AE63